jgi:hypothetical protein
VGWGVVLTVDFIGSGGVCQSTRRRWCSRLTTTEVLILVGTQGGEVLGIEKFVLDH